ncbi:hypothetical protein H9L05_21470 (plasmid) [Hymenobacter qilianensis]|uniref:Uncharacterized protein n=1 Tax=Hymenobacter qilianensis TaxID=1385715 RepID=A0A7H0H130_9BACT|nr:hypothetical protein [Hymenobacter qilianensis]QNP54246.1 hypothetical protein H9L05_21470 [Hymenobacter qilianensis]
MRYTDPNFNYYNTESWKHAGASGTLTITAISTVTRRMSGTFSFVVIGTVTNPRFPDKRTITNGTFTNVAF